MKPLLGTSDELSVLEIMGFGPPAKPPYKGWNQTKKIDVRYWPSADMPLALMKCLQRTSQIYAMMSTNDLKRTLATLSKCR